MNAVFISYARENGPWVRRLVEALLTLDKEAWVDWERIPVTAEWWFEIVRAIDESDAFVFVITRASADSATCQQEIAHAVLRGKRILPVALEPVDSDILPRAIASIQWIPAEGESSDVAARIQSAYQTDLAWLREQARLTVLASEWEKNKCARDFELSGENLERAERWLARSDPAAERIATPLVTSFILASRRGATRRTRRALVTSLAVLTVTAVLGGVAYFLYLRSERERREAVTGRLAAESVRSRLEGRPQRAVLLAAAAVRTQTDRGESANVEALDALYASAANLGGRPIGAVASSIEAVGVLSANRCVTGSDDGQLHVWDTSGSGPPVLSIDAHKGGVTLVTVQPPKKLLISGGHDRLIRIWIVESDGLHLVDSYAHPARIRAAHLQPGARELVTTSWDGHIAVHELTDQGKIAKTTVVMIKDSMDAGVDPTGRWLAAITASGAVTLIDRRDSEPHPISVVAHRSAGSVVAFSADGRWLATSGVGQNIAVFDLSAKSPARSMRLLKGHEGSVFALAFRKEGSWLASSSDDGTARLWNVDEVVPGKSIVLSGHTAPVRAVAFVPGASLRIATASNDRTARLWIVDPTDPSTPQSVVLRGHDDVVTGLAVNQDGARLVTTGRDGSLRGWDLNDPDPGRAQFAEVRRDHRDEVRALEIAADGLRAVSADYSGTACRWSFDPVSVKCRPAPVTSAMRLGIVPCADTDEYLVRMRRGGLMLCRVLDGGCDTLRAANANIMAAACSLSRIAAADASGRVFVWRHGEATAARELQPPLSGLPLAMAFSPDDRFLASADDKGKVVVWVGENSAGSVLPGHTDGVTVLTFDKTARTLVSAGFDATPRQWDLAKMPPQLVAQLPGHTQSATAPLGVTGAVFDPAGRFLATAGVDATVRLWPMQGGIAGRDARILQGHEQGTFGHGVKSLSISGRWLASGGDDGLVRLWDLTSVTPALAGIGLPGHTRTIRSVHFIRNGQDVISASDDTTVRIWPTSTERLLRAVCGEAGRDLWPEERSRYFGSAKSTDAACGVAMAQR